MMNKNLLAVRRILKMTKTPGLLEVWRLEVVELHDVVLVEGKSRHSPLKTVPALLMSRPEANALVFSAQPAAETEDFDR